jgi:F-type H+/Na+-transporting ATPase subunit alpha
MTNDDAIVHQHEASPRLLSEYPAALSASQAPASDTAADKWLGRARAAVDAARLGAKAEEIGRVEEVGDGIALISGLPNVRLDELLQFQKGQFGFAQVLERNRIGCVVLDDVDGVEAGDTVRGTGDVVRVPVGPALLGRVVDPLGRPLDGNGPIATDAKEPIERPAPSIIDRDAVVQPVQTGLIVVDTLFALGRGQRELIIGDRAIGKTTIAIDTIINQKTSDMICVYVAVGQKSSNVRRAIDSIQGHGAVDRCIIVVAEAAGSPGLQWIAPFAGFTMAEYFRDRGQHALVVIDDLTKHAATHREIALLTRQSPGREAYPGDVFYVHARLLERAAKLSKEKGGGSLTALPIAETDAGNLSAYIPTNLISITDGQIVLDTKLFHEGQKPAVDVGTSVSRVGGKTQAHALREAAETVRLDYAQFLELETFTRFGGMPDARVRDQLTRGTRIRAILGQARHLPVRLADEVALVLAVQSGLLDGLPLPAVVTFRLGLTDALDHGAADCVKSIQETGTLDDMRKQALLDTLKRYVQSVAPPKTGAKAASNADNSASTP